MCRRGVVAITTAYLHSTKPKLWFCAGSNPARGVSESRDCQDFWQRFWLEIRLNAFRRSTTIQKRFIIIIITYHSVILYFNVSKSQTYSDYYHCEGNIPILFPWYIDQTCHIDQFLTWLSLCNWQHLDLQILHRF